MMAAMLRQEAGTRRPRQRNTQADRDVRRPTAKQHDERSPAQMKEESNARSNSTNGEAKRRPEAMHVGRWIRRHAVLAAVALLLTALVSPRKIQGQLPSPCCAVLAAGLGTINSTLGSVIGGGLQSINTVLSDISNFEQTVSMAEASHREALGMAGQIQGFYAQIRGIFRIPIADARRCRTRDNLRAFCSRATRARFRTRQAGMAAVYGAVPTPQNAPPPVRDIIDMTDAVAQDAMERAIAIDAIADQELAAADQINTNVQSATPGSAPIIEAQADAWLVRAHAYTQSALADLMRVRAIDLANNGAHLKLGSAWAVTTQQNVTTTLQHK